MREKLSMEQGKVLLRLARNTIAIRLGIDGVTEEAYGAISGEYGTFVTLKLHGQLRGCIGNLTALGSLVESVQQNAIQAAFNDHRFSPLREDEFDQVKIDISLLNKPQPLNYSGAEDLIARLRPGIDGVIVQQGMAKATFLPQVWQQLPDPRQFLEHLCLKAGLVANAWQGGNVRIETYQVQCFAEDDI